MSKPSWTGRPWISAASSSGPYIVSMRKCFRPSPLAATDFITSACHFVIGRAFVFPRAAITAKVCRAFTQTFCRKFLTQNSTRNHFSVLKIPPAQISPQ